VETPANRFGYLALQGLIWTLPFGLFPVFEQPSVSQRFYFQLAVTAIALAYFGASWAGGHLRLPTNAVLWAGFIYLVCVTASSAVARSAWFTLKEAAFLWCGFLMMAMIVHLRLTPRRCRRLLASYALIAGLCAAYGVVQYLGLDVRWGTLGYAPEIKEGRFHVLSLLGHPNYLTAYLGPALLLCPGLIATSSSRRMRIVLGVAAVTLALCIVLAGTRSAWLATMILGGGLAAAFASKWPSLRLSRQMWKVAVVVAGLFALFIIPNPMMPRRYSFLARLGESRPVLGRFYFYVAATRMIAQHPILGVGYNNFGVEFWDCAAALQEEPANRFYSYILEDLGGVRPDHVHDEYLEIASETGVLGLTSFLFLAAVFFMRAREEYLGMSHWSQRLMVAGTGAAAAYLLMDCLFSFPVRLPCSGMAFWLMLGIGSRYAQSETLLLAGAHRIEPKPPASASDRAESPKRKKRSKKR
jgi:O-antigen ligase